MDKVAITKSLLDNLADHINAKAGTTGPKTIEQMQNTVDGIDTAEPMQEKSVEITENGMTEVTPDTGYGGLSKVSITGNVQPNLENGVASISQNGETTITPSDGFDGLSRVRITVDVPATSQTPTEEKTVDLDMSNGDQVVEPTSGYAMSKLTINKPDTMLPENIKKNVNIGGVVGILETETEEVTVTLSMAEGDQTVTPTDGKLLSKVTVTKPGTLVPENIKSGVSIAGITGTYAGGGSGDLPQLHAPTISINEDTLTITNPESNGDFVTSYELYNGDTKVGTASGTTVDLTQIFTDEVDYTLTVRCAGTNFENSPDSNSVKYTNIYYSVTNTLVGCQNTNPATRVRKQTAYSATIVALNGFDMFGAKATVSMDGTDITKTAYNDGDVSIQAVTGNISIAVTALESSGLKWTLSSEITELNSSAILYDGALLTPAYSTSTNKYAKTTDGVTWTSGYIGRDSYYKTQTVSLWRSGGKIYGLFNNGTRLFATSNINNVNGTSIGPGYNISNPTLLDATWGNGVLSVIIGSKSGSTSLSYTSFYTYTYSDAGNNIAQKGFNSTIVKPTTSNYTCSMQYGAGKFVMIASDKNIYTCEDGFSWELAGTAPYYGGMSYVNNEFILSGSGKVSTSADGITWELQGSYDVTSAGSIVYTGEKYVALGSDSSGGVLLMGDSLSTLSISPSGFSGSRTLVYFNGKLVTTSSGAAYYGIFE